MAMTDKEKEWADKMRRFIKAELKRANVTYAELAQRLNEHGLEGETEASVNSKLGCVVKYPPLPATGGPGGESRLQHPG